MKITDMRVGMFVQFKAKNACDDSGKRMNEVYRVTTLTRERTKVFCPNPKRPSIHIIDWVDIETINYETKWMREFEAKSLKGEDLHVWLKR